ncbi:MAG TPA: tetratricopeptide repeat protein [Pirellulaceae bacterium]|nr:tetratricopeptide repeat protein [Pirellulaceae bacterium]
MTAESEHEQAAELLKGELAARPDDVRLLRELARCYVRQRKFLPALETYDRIIGLGAADAAVWYEAGKTLCDVREYAQALDALGHSTRLHPSDEARYETARASFALGDVETASALFESVAAATDSIQAWSSLAKIIPGVPSADHAKVRQVRRAFADRLRRDVAAPPKRGGTKPHAGHERLRLGYLSAFFNRSNYMKPVWGLVNHHDRRDFEVHLFSDTPLKAGMEGYRQQSSDRIHEVEKLDHLELARLIRECEIDILIDLNAYSSAERLPLFLAPVAPVVVGWFNLYATSGLSGIDVIVGDREVVRVDEESEYTERVLCLPSSYLTFEVGHRAPPVVPPPCEASGHFTFGSLVSQYKLTSVVLDDWAEILRRVESSRLVLANRALQSTCNQEYLLKQFTDRGVRPEQLEFLRPAEHYQFLDYYSRIDLALDAYPYNGGTTTMEAIWQGVPVLTAGGDRWASRTSQTLLRRTHLAEFVAADRRAYVETAVDMATDLQTPSKLATLRATMRERLLASPACDTAALARGMEQIYRQLAS